MPAIRPAAVAGTFYPADPAVLRQQVKAWLADLEVDPVPSRGAVAAVAPKLIVVPHAGYVYSGAVAAQAYARLAPYAGRIRRVVLVGPTHRVAVRGLAVPDVDAFETPLGRIPIDTDARDALDALPQVVRSDLAHRDEHSLEVQLPFLQVALGTGFRVLPLAVGDASVDEVAEVLERLWGGEETLVVISSDLSHFLPYDQACQADRRTVTRIAARATDLRPEDACGAHALNGALAVARRHGLTPELLDLCNSGDTAGDRRRVVGYAAFACRPEASGDVGTPAEPDDARLGDALLARARNAIAAPLGFDAVHEPAHPALADAGATFVTLHDAAGDLRGCIGSLQAIHRLDDDVRHNAHAAAFGDPRFPPLAAHEWRGLQIEVSLLGPSQPLPPASTRAEALRHVRPHVDGLVFEWRGRRSTFLPQVWEQLPDAEAFLDALVVKAGLPSHFWAEDVTLKRYRVRKFAWPARDEEDGA
jgi:hypothetical protein